jgi:hypothetical protein
MFWNTGSLGLDGFFLFFRLDIRIPLLEFFYTACSVHDLLLACVKGVAG